MLFTAFHSNSWRSFLILFSFILGAFQFPHSQTANAQSRLFTDGQVHLMHEEHTQSILTRVYNAPDTVHETAQELTVFHATHMGYQIETTTRFPGAKPDTTVYDYSSAGRLRAVSYHSPLRRSLTRYHYDVHDSISEEITSDESLLDTMHRGTEIHTLYHRDSLERRTEVVVASMGKRMHRDVYHYNSFGKCDTIRSFDERDSIRSTEAIKYDAQQREVLKLKSALLLNGDRDTVKSEIVYKSDGGFEVATFDMKLVPPEHGVKHERPKMGQPPPRPNRALQLATSEAYDSRGMLVKSTNYALKGMASDGVTLTYDPAGNKLTERHARFRPDGAEDGSDLEVYLYDSKGNLLEQQDLHNDRYLAGMKFFYTFSQ